MRLAPHVLFETLLMAYVSFEMLVAPIMINILIVMHLAHSNILDYFFET
jgi:hypothetical protein